MKAHKFVAEHGIERARDVVELAPQGATHLSKDTGHYVNANFEPMPAHIKEQLPSLIVIAELKQVVESVDYLNEWYEGKIDDAYDHVERMHGMLKLKPQFPNLHSRIKLVEGHLANYELVESYKQVKCEVLDMVDVSPRCEVRNG